MMHSRLLPLVLAIVLSSCRHDYSASVLFYNHSLEDSLELYISQVRDIQNPYGAPTIMDIWINVDSDDDGKPRDTLVFVSASYRISGPPGSQDSWDEPIISYPCLTKGAGWISGRMCVIKYINNYTFSNLVNEALLTIPPKQFDFFSSYDGPIYDVRISRSSRLYRVHGKDSVTLISKDVGDFELFVK